MFHRSSKLNARPTSPWDDRADPAGTTIALHVAGVTLAFGGVAALRDVSLRVVAGEIHSVIGPNGAGKSSLLNVVTGLHRTVSGTVTIADRTFDRVPVDRLAALGVGRTFQNLALFKGLSVFGNVLVGGDFAARAGVIAQLVGTRRARQEERSAHERAREIIGFLGLQDVADRAVATLPYGLQKRVEIARAMIVRPRLLLLDEPMAGMAHADKMRLAETIDALRSHYGTAIVLIEHDIGVVMRLSDRITVLDHGVRIASGPPSRIASDRAVIDAYLGVARDDPAARSGSSV